MRKLGAQCTAAFVAAALLVAGCGSSKEEGLRTRAHEALAAGDLAEARDLLQQAIDETPADPNQAPAYNDIGVIYQRLGKIDDAIVAFENSHRLDSLLPGPAYNLGVLLYERGDLQRAAALFQDAALADPSDARPLEFAAAIEMGAERWSGAEDLLQQALVRAPKSSRIRSSLGVARLHTRGASEAMTNLLEAIEMDPEYAAPYFNLAVIHQDWLGDSDGAVGYMNQFLKTAPDDSRTTAALEFIDAIEDPGAIVDPGMRLDDPPVTTDEVELPEPDAVDAVDGGSTSAPPDSDSVEAPPPETGTPDPFESVEEPPPSPTERVVIRPPDIKRRPRTVDGLLALARDQAGQGDTAQAYRTCREARSLAEQRGDSTDAERVVMTTVSICQDQAGAHYDYGLYLMKQDQHDAALRSFKQAVGLAPQWVPAYLGMAETAVRTGQYDAAHIALKRALRIDPGNREATWGLAGLYDKGMDRPEEAIAAYRQFLTQHGGDSRARTARTRIAALQQRLVDSVNPPATDDPGPVIRTTVREQDPAPADLNISRPRIRNHKAAVEAYNRGTIYQAREDWDQAIFFYTRALEADDTFALAYYNLGKVYQTQKKPALAIAAYEESIRLQPRHVNSRFNVALLYRELNQNDQAAAQLQNILRMDASHARSYYLLGLIYSGNRSTQQQAISYFERFLQLSPNDRAAPAVRQWLAEPPR